MSSPTSKSLPCTIGFAFLRGEPKARDLLPELTGQDSRVVQVFLHALDLWEVCEARQRYECLRILGTLVFMLPDRLRPIARAALGRVDASPTVQEALWGRMLESAFASSVCSSPSWLSARPGLQGLGTLTQGDKVLFRAALHVVDELGERERPLKVDALRALVGLMTVEGRMLFGSCLPFFNGAASAMWKEVASGPA